METAAALLADAGNPPLAPHLAANIRAAVGSFRPACVLDQLKARHRGRINLNQILFQKTFQK